MNQKSFKLNIEKVRGLQNSILIKELMSRSYQQKPQRSKQQQQEFYYVVKGEEDQPQEPKESSYMPQQRDYKKTLNQKGYGKKQYDKPKKDHKKYTQDEDYRRDDPPSRYQKWSQLDAASKDEERDQFDINKVQQKELTQVLIKRFKNRRMDCPVCYENIQHSAKIWNCVQCHQPFHLNCIHKWIRNLNPFNKGVLFNWSCPKCNMIYQDTLPEYKCFCGKQNEPESDNYAIPHACSQRCDKKRGNNCPHPCPMDCHPGPCPECQVVGIIVPCHCGKQTRQMRCSEAKKDFSCGQLCGRALNCGQHLCQRPCHFGACDPCAVEKSIPCFCNRSQSLVNCAVNEISCGQPCGKLLDCGNHACTGVCHPACPPCMLKPELLKTCSCGRFPLSELLLEPRKSCLDPVPNCGSPIEGILLCGHKSRSLCGEPYPPCQQKVKQQCRCGQNELIKYCKDQGEFICEKICRKKLRCGVHTCQQQCCSEKSHLCMRICGKVLACGNHNCDQFCHLGLCQGCPISIIAPISCPCGKSVINPPQKCGTKPPSCMERCRKLLICGHECQSMCHSGACPPCLESIEKQCNCGASKIVTVCSKVAVCRTVCNKQLKCGHKCQETCQAQEICPANQQASCGQKCGKKRICGHPCQEECHPNQECPLTVCRIQMRVVCSCGNRDAFVECGAIDEPFEKSLKCDQKCTNIRRFGAFYKSNQLVDLEKTYYPDVLLKYAHYNLQALQKLEQQIEYFLVHSSEVESYDFSLQKSEFQELRKTSLQILFSRHYRFDVQILRYNKAYNFTLYKTMDTTIPKIKLSEYFIKVQKGVIKRDHQPFKVKLRCVYDFSSAELVSIENQLSDLKNDYYFEKHGQSIILSFWEESHADIALKKLKRMVGLLSVNWQLEINHQAMEEESRLSLLDSEIIVKPKTSRKSQKKLQAYQDEDLQVHYSPAEENHFKALREQYFEKAQCEKFCDEAEINDRIAKKELDIFEEDPFYQYESVAKPERIIRKYRRNQPEMTPQFLRTPDTLIKVVDFMFLNYLNADSDEFDFKKPMQEGKISELTYQEIWKYINDRLTQVRIEMMYLGFKPDDLMTRMIRFYVISHSQLKDCKENLKQLSILLAEQDDLESMQYKLLLGCFQDNFELSELILKIEQLQLTGEPIINTLVQIATASRSGNFIPYLDYYGQTQNQLHKSLMYPQVPQIHSIIFKTIEQSTIQLDLKQLQAMLKLDSIQATVKLLQHLGIPTAQYEEALAQQGSENFCYPTLEFKQLKAKNQVASFSPLTIDRNLIFQ